jgi:hypothetical protein
MACDKIAQATTSKNLITGRRSVRIMTLRLAYFINFRIKAFFQRLHHADVLMFQAEFDFLELKLLCLS